jgi:hypothetical protein
MRTTIFECDKCGKNVKRDGDQRMFNVRVVQLNVGSSILHYPLDIDLCDDCYSGIDAISSFFFGNAGRVK